MKCPVCETQHTENDIETCSVCGYDLTPYPPVLGQIPPEFLEKEKKRILAAKRVWERSQIKVAEAEAIASKFQSKREENSMISSSDWNYTKLIDFLESGNWKAADEETARMMLAVAGRTLEGYLNADDIEKFPCEDLRIIDHLWVKYSNGRFGFSVQKQIYLNCGGKPDSNFPSDTIWYKFTDEVGWRVNESFIDVDGIKYDFGASRGHLPSFWFGFWGVWVRSSLAQRLVNCSI